MPASVQRKLTTLLAADAVGYSRAMDQDELKALADLRTARSVFSKFIERHYGRIVNTAGDGLIAEFPSVVEAVQCAIEVQQELGGLTAAKEALAFRVGIHLGDVIVDGNDLLGEGVNLASRLESMAEPGGILISQQVYDQVHHKLTVGFEYAGEKRPKNLSEDVSVYRLSLKPEPMFSMPKIFQPKASSEPQSTPEKSLDQVKQKTRKLAKLFGFILAILVILNVSTSQTLWVHWPAIAMLGIVCISGAPLVTRGWFNVQYARLAVIISILVLINLATWTGYPWALWPVVAIVCIGIAKRWVFG